MPTHQQFKAARALLEWTRAEVGRRTGLSEVTIKRVEIATGTSQGTCRRVREVFEAAGVQWIGTGGGLDSSPGEAKGADE